MPMPTCIQLCIPSLIKGHRWRNQWLFTSPHDHDEQTHLNTENYNYDWSSLFLTTDSEPPAWKRTMHQVAQQKPFLTKYATSLAPSSPLMKMMNSHLKSGYHLISNPCPIWDEPSDATFTNPYKVAPPATYVETIPFKFPPEIKAKNNWPKNLPMNSNKQTKSYATGFTSVPPPSREQTVSNNRETQPSTSITTHMLQQWMLGCTSILQLVPTGYHRIISSLFLTHF